MMTNFPLISTASALEQFIDSLGAARVVALDTEFIREKTYHPQLCLVQLRCGEQVAGIDALAVSLEPLAALLAAPGRVCVLHSCRQDLEALATRFEVRLGQLFDTQLAAGFCGYGAQLSYAALVEKICGRVLPKAFTRADWRMRPLAPGQLEYALDDVNYLLPVHAALVAQLEELGRSRWLSEECRLLAQVDFRDHAGIVAQAWRRVGGAARLSPAAQACAQALAVWREQRAMACDRPREWVLSSTVLLQISSVRPTDRAELARIEGVGARLARRSGEQILAVVAKAAETELVLPRWPEALTPAQRALVKTCMRALQQAAQEYAIDPALLANRGEVEQLVRGGRELPLLKGWRREVVGARLLELVGE